MNSEKDYYIESLEKASVNEIINLLSKSLSNTGISAKTHNFWNWKHNFNPFGPSLGLIAKSHSNTKLVSIRAFLLWKFLNEKGVEVKAIRPVDTVTDKDWRGRGLFKSLTLKGIKKFSVSDRRLIFNTPNSNSLPGYIKMGWKVSEELQLSFRFTGVIRLVCDFALNCLPGLEPNNRYFSSNVVRNFSSLDASELDEVISFMLECEKKRHSIGLRTARSYDYFYWRYISNPNIDYFVYTSRGLDGKLDKLAIVRRDSRNLLNGVVLNEMYTFDNAIESYKLLVNELLKSLNVSYIICHFSKGSKELKSLNSLGFRYVRTMNLAARLLNSEDKCFNALKWDLTFSDLEVF